MASIASASPSGNSYQRAESTDDSDSWQYIDSNPASVFFPSPVSGSLNSWGVVGYPNQVGQSPPAVSPLQLDPDHQHAYSASFQESQDTSMMANTGIDNPFMASFPGDQQFIPGQEFMFQDNFNRRPRLRGLIKEGETNCYLEALDISPYYNNLQDNMGNITGLESLDMPPQPVDLGIPQQFRDGGDQPPWDPTNLKDDTSYLMTDFMTTPSPRQSSSGSAYLSSSPRSPDIKLEKAPSPIRKIKASGGGKIEKRRAEPASKFVIMTPTIINASTGAGKPNPFECFDAMRTTQKGRKGPLANEVKENALQVRRLGACFCCHARKVKVCGSSDEIQTGEIFTNIVNSATRNDLAGTAPNSQPLYLRLYAGSSKTSFPCSSRISSADTSRRTRWPCSSVRTSKASQWMGWRSLARSNYSQGRGGNPRSKSAPSSSQQRRLTFFNTGT